LAPIRAIDVPVTLPPLSTLADFLPPNNLRRSRIVWKNDDAAAVSFDDEGLESDDADGRSWSSTRVTDADLSARSTPPDTDAESVEAGVAPPLTPGANVEAATLDE
jgi:hypothetical protein